MKIKIVFNPIYNGSNIRSTIEEVGYNTGNVVFTEAIKENVTFDEESMLDLSWTRENRGRSNVFSIMPAANFLSANTTWVENLIPILENTDIQFTFAGLGAQASLKAFPRDVVSKLSERQIYFYKLVSERANTIGVRGEFTAECLHELGINNVEVIGCPSFYKYDGEFPRLPEIDREGKILYGINKKLTKISELAKTANAKIICQTTDDIDEGEPIFYNYNEWNAYLEKEKFSFAFGSRFHGNMMALRNGIPTVWIVHDWRTLELARYLGVPYVEYYSEKFRDITNVYQLMECCDYDNVYKNYTKLHKKYREFINRNLNENND